MIRESYIRVARVALSIGVLDKRRRTARKDVCEGEDEMLMPMVTLMAMTMMLMMWFARNESKLGAFFAGAVQGMRAHAEIR